MEQRIREFGTAVPGQIYILRPGGYSVIRERGVVAVVLAPGGAYLPGGAQQAEESPEQAAVREALEECGLRIRSVAASGSPTNWFTLIKSIFISASDALSSQPGL